MEQIAQQLDYVRREMVHLLEQYPEADENCREQIYERCELLGGEIQELVGLLKLEICHARRDPAREEDFDPLYIAEIERMSRESLSAIHVAGEEVACAIRMLRVARNEDHEDET